MTGIRSEEIVAETLWVLIKVGELACAVDSSNVTAILMLEDDIKPMPNSNEINVGVIHFRGSVLPISDLRKQMGMQSQIEEVKDFEAMLDQRKQDHIHWVEELKRSLKDKSPFHLATDPHKCAFGKWYYQYEPTNQAVAFHLRKIEEPHSKLHESAHAAFECEKNCESCTRGECLETVLKRETEVYMKTVLQLIEEAKQIFRDNHRKMVVVISDGESQTGLLVDEVIAVENVLPIPKGGQILTSETEPIVEQVAERKSDHDLILVLNTHRLLQQPEEVTEQSVEAIPVS